MLSVPTEHVGFSWQLDKKIFRSAAEGRKTCGLRGCNYLTSGFLSENHSTLDSCFFILFSFRSFYSMFFFLIIIAHFFTGYNFMPKITTVFLDEWEQYEKIKKDAKTSFFWLWQNIHHLHSTPESSSWFSKLSAIYLAHIFIYQSFKSSA